MVSAAACGRGCREGWRGRGVVGGGDGDGGRAGASHGGARPSGASRGDARLTPAFKGENRMESEGADID